MNENTYNIISIVVNTLIMIAGFSALIVYFIQEKNKLKSAAKLVVSQINHIESCVTALRNNKDLNLISVYESKPLITNNYWEEYRHILARKLDEHQVKTIENFYSLSEEIEKSRDAICNSIIKTWENKELVYQYNLAQSIFMHIPIEEARTNLNTFDASSMTFIPNLPIEYLKINLSNFTFINGSVVFHKLCKISGC